MTSEQAIELQRKAKLGLSETELESRIIVPLVNAGLVAQISTLEPLHIVGGRTFEVSDGFSIYEDGFIICQENATYSVIRKKGKKNIKGKKTPEEIVNWIIFQYQK